MKCRCNEQRFFHFEKFIIFPYHQGLIIDFLNSYKFLSRDSNSKKDPEKNK